MLKCAFFKRDALMLLFQNKIRKISLLTLMGLLSFSTVTQAMNHSEKFKWIDTEVHFVNFFQEGDGINRLISNMDKANISDVALMGMGVMKKWSHTEPQKPKYIQGDDASVYWFSATDYKVLSAVKSLPIEQQARIHPFISGFNPTDLNAARQIEQMLKENPNFWQGIGEVLTRHDHLTALTDGEKPRANHPAMDGVYTVAAKYDLPVIVHSNITSPKIAQPLYGPELEEVLGKHPETNIVWAHGGTSSAIDKSKLSFLPEYLDDVLSSHKNLYILLSWSIRDYLYSDIERQEPNPTWLKLITKHADRFMVGSDLIGRFDRLGSTIGKLSVFIDHLPEPVAEQVLRKNFLSLVRG